MLQGIKLLSNTRILHVSFWKTKYAKQIVLWRQFQSSNMGSRTKATLALPAVAASHPMFAMAWTPIPRISLSFVSWGGLSEAEEARWHWLGVCRLSWERHTGLMRIWGWGKVGAALSSSWAGHCDVPCERCRAPLWVCSRSCVCFVSLLLSLWFLPCD